MSLEESTSNSCTFCLSHKTHEKAIKIGRDRVIYRHCAACKRDLRIWDGSEAEYQRRRSTLNRIRRKLRAQERKLKP